MNSKVVVLADETTGADVTTGADETTGFRQGQDHRFRDPGAGPGRGGLRDQPARTALRRVRERRSDAGGVRGLPVPGLGPGSPRRAAPG